MEFKEFIRYIGVALFALAAVAALLNVIKGNNPITGKPWGSNETSTPEPTEPPPELRKMSHRDIGRAIALSLHHYEGIHDIDPDEEELIKNSSINRSLFIEEKFLLAAAAQSFTIHKHLRNKSAWEEVMSGHREVWDNLKNQGPAGVAFLEKFTNRCVAYSHAATTLDNGIFDGITLEFAKNLSETDPSAILLATLTAPPIYKSNAKTTEHVLHEANII